MRYTILLAIVFCLLSLTLCSMLAPPPARATVSLPAIISDNMVLQAGKTLPIWGTADPGERVTVMLGDDTEATTANAYGKWLVRLKPRPASDVPMMMTVKGTNRLVIKNILIGSVWVCSGQSNMEYFFNKAQGADLERPKAQYPKLRLFTVARSTAYTPQDDCRGAWLECTPDTVNWFSAVGYFFGRDIHVATGVPVGLISTCWGGTPAQDWVSRDGLAREPALFSMVQEADYSEKCVVP